jgi:hypothetical protein
MNKVAIGLLALLSVACVSRPSEWKIELTKLESPAAASSGEPYLISDGTDTTLLSWIEKKGDTSFLKFSALTQKTWSSPQTIASGNNWFVNWADYPMVSKHGKHLVAHFLEKSGDGTFAYDVKYTQSRDNGITWSTPAVLHDDGKEAEHGFVSLLPYGENFLVTWLDGRNTVMEGMEGMDHHGHHGEMSLRAAILSNDGNKISEWELDNRTCDCCQTTAALTDNGPVVIYRDRSDKEVRDMSIVRLIDGAWTKPVPIYSDNWLIEGCPVNGPRMEAIGNTIAVAWYSMPGEKSEVKVIFSKNGGETFDQPIQVDEGTAIGRVDLVMLDQDNVVVSWMEGAVIKAARVSSDGHRSNSFVVASSSESRSSGFPQLAKTKTDLIFAWTNSANKNIQVVTVPIPNAE